MIERSSADGVTVLTLNHGKVNALDLEFCEAITATFRDLAAGPPHGVVVTGAGRAFSAGVDLWRIVDGGPDYVRRFIRALVDAFEAVFLCPLPIVAAVNGHAIAGGCVLTSCCDYRVMTSSPAGIGIPELLVGVPFPAAAWDIMAYAVGAPAARRAAFTGSIYQPAEALSLDFVDELSSSVLPTAIAHATRLASSIPAATFAVTKRQLRSGVLRPTDLTEVTALWQARAADGWIRDYLSRTLNSPTRS